MLIRKYHPGEELALRDIFHSSVHKLGSTCYSTDQLDVWAPNEFDPEQWILRIQKVNPWVLELEGQIAAFADLQPDGYIDLFYVSGLYGRRGLGSILLCHLIKEASPMGLCSLFSNVSLSAQPLFLKFGFTITSINTFMLRGVEISNARMVKRLSA